VGNVLDAFDDVHPAKIIIKLKLHILVHLQEDIWWYGLAIRNSTEIFECFNAIFRLCSVYSNHQAPSRDIAYKFASMDRLKHILSGGFWKEGSEWVQAGRNVRNVLRHEPIIQRHLGWVSQAEPSQGMPARFYLKYVLTHILGHVFMAGRARSPACKWDETITSGLTGGSSTAYGSKMWRKGVALTSQAEDKCLIGSWVFFKDSSVSCVRTYCYSYQFLNWFNHRALLLLAKLQKL